MWTFIEAFTRVCALMHSLNPVYTSIFKNEKKNHINLPTEIHLWHFFVLTWASRTPSLCPKWPIVIPSWHLVWLGAFIPRPSVLFSRPGAHGAQASLTRPASIKPSSFTNTFSHMTLAYPLCGTHHYLILFWTFFFLSWLRWVCLAACSLSLVAARRARTTLCGSALASHCGGFFGFGAWTLERRHSRCGAWA